MLHCKQSAERFSGVWRPGWYVCGPNSYPYLPVGRTAGYFFGDDPFTPLAEAYLWNLGTFFRRK